MSMADDYVKQNPGWINDASTLSGLLKSGVSSQDKTNYDNADRLATYTSHPNAIKKYGVEYTQNGVDRAWVPDGNRAIIPENNIPNDGQAYLMGEGYTTLKDIIPDSEIYQYDPRTARTTVRFYNDPENKTAGSYDGDTVYVNTANS